MNHATRLLAVSVFLLGTLPGGASGGATGGDGTDAALAPRPPQADAGADRDSECTSPAGDRVTLDGSGSTDPDSTPGTNDDIVLFEWFEDFGSPGQRPLGEGEIRDETLSIGTHLLTLVVTDRTALSDTDEVRHRVLDTTPPWGDIVYPTGGSCLGFGEVPVTVLDDFFDLCDTDLERLFELRQRKLLASDGGRSFEEHYGQALATDGSFLVVGAPDHTHSGIRSGSAYVLRPGPLGWVEQQELLASDRRPLDQFGASVAIRRDIIAIGAPGHDLPTSNAGAVWIFRRQGAVWVEEAKLSASDAGINDNFGHAVAVGEEVVVGGAPRSDAFAPDSGAAFVFRPVGNVWTETQRLGEPLLSGGGRFGSAVAIDGQRMIVGAPLDDFPFNSGRVLVFNDDGGGWVERQNLAASDAASSAQFGSTVALHGDTAVIGAPFHPGSGQAYVFEDSGDGWTETARLTPSDAGVNDRFGAAVAVHGGRALVGAPRFDYVRQNAGAAFLFSKSGTGWVERRRLVDPVPNFSDYMGQSVGASATGLFVGVIGDDTRNFDAGAVFAFEGAGGTFFGHADHTAELTVFDDAGNEATASVAFAIDLVPPQVTLETELDRLALPTSLPFTDLFRTSDNDGVTGGPVHERLSLDGCLVFDGRTYGDGDGLLSDETLTIDTALLCEALVRCELQAFDVPQFRVEATDCGGNVGSAARSVQLDPVVDADACGDGP